MQIAFIPLGLSDDLMNIPLSEIDSELLEDIKQDLTVLDSGFRLFEKNYGEGADWVMLLAILNGITTVFLLGEKIDKGIKGWVEIGKRIKSIISKCDRFYIDIDAARIFGLQHLSKEEKIKSIRIIMESELAIKDLSGMIKDRNPIDFIAKPFSVYFITYEINYNLIISLGIRSDGMIEEHYRFDRRNFIPF